MTKWNASKAAEMTKVAGSAATKLGLFIEGKMELTESHFDACCDALIAVMEEARDESYRLKPDEE